MKSRCRICSDECPDVTKRFDPVYGFICTECHGFLLAADRRMRRVGIEGVTLKPVRHAGKGVQP